MSLQAPILVRKRKFAASGGSRLSSPALSRRQSSSSFHYVNHSPAARGRPHTLDPKAINGSEWTKGPKEKTALKQETHKIVRGVMQGVSGFAASLKAYFSGDEHGGKGTEVTDQEANRSSKAYSESRQYVKKRKANTEKDNAELEAVFKTPSMQKTRQMTLKENLDNITFHPEIRSNFDNIQFGDSMSTDTEKIPIEPPKINDATESDYGTAFFKPAVRSSSSTAFTRKFPISSSSSSKTSSLSPDIMSSSRSSNSEKYHSSIERLTTMISAAFGLRSRNVNVKEIPDFVILKERKLETRSKFSLRFDHNDLTFAKESNYYNKRLRELQELNDRIHKEAEEAVRAKSSIVHQVTPEEDNEVIGIWKCKGKDQQVLSLVKNIEIKVIDYKTLADKNWLNDTVIEAYLKTLDSERIHTFNSFFFTNIEDKGYQGVAKWLKRSKRELKKLDLIILPINVQRTHWVCGAIDLKNKQALYMDSLSTFQTSHGERSLNLMLDYVKGQAKREGCPELADGWTTKQLTDCPQQQNGFDCGVFTLMNALYLSKGIALSYNPSEAKNFRRVITLALLRYSAAQ